MRKFALALSLGASALLLHADDTAAELFLHGQEDVEKLLDAIAQLLESTTTHI